MRFKPGEPVPFWLRGSTTTGLAGIASPEPLLEPCPWTVTFVLRPAGVFMADRNITRDEVMGDSNFAVAEHARAYFSTPNDLPVDTPNGRVVATMQLHTNQRGRLGRIDMRVSSGPSSVQAYNVAKTALDFLHLRIALKTEIPLVFDFCRIQDENNPSRFAIRYPTPYPTLALDFDDRILPPVIQRVAAPYIEALASNSHFYSFLCRFKLVESLTGEIQRSFRMLAKTYNLRLHDLTGKYKAEDIGAFAPEFVNVSYRQSVQRLNGLRVRVAHLLTSLGFQALNTFAQEQAERASHVLHIASHDLLHYAIDNYQILKDANISPTEIDRALETFPKRSRGAKEQGS